jgi:hypothetical protein
VSDEETKAVAAIGAGPAAKELYVDLAKPAAVEMSKNLSAVAKLVTHALAPLHGLVWGLDQVRDWLTSAVARRLEKVEPEEIQTPPANVAGQILLQLPFCAEEEHLREMYASLLASAMNKQTVQTVHPAFVHVVQQLTSDEAVILSHAATPGFRVDLVETTLQDGRTESGSSISEQFRVFCDGAGVRYPEHSDAYLDNLLRLKILVEQYWTEGTFHGAHTSTHYDDEVPASVMNSNTRAIELSAFGERFMAACVAGRRSER